MKRSNRKRRWWPEGRALFLVDVENIAGCGKPSAVDVAQAADRLARAVPSSAGDHVVVGVADNGVLACGLAWPGALLVVGSGPDGADRALLAQASPHDLAARYDRVVIASGDGIFSELAARLRRLGIEVVVASRGEACSAQLRLAATSTVTWSGPGGPPIALEDVSSRVA